MHCQMDSTCWEQLGPEGRYKKGEYINYVLFYNLTDIMNSRAYKSESIYFSQLEQGE